MLYHSIIHIFKKYNKMKFLKRGLIYNLTIPNLNLTLPAMSMNFFKTIKNIYKMIAKTLTLRYLVTTTMKRKRAISSQAVHQSRTHQCISTPKCLGLNKTVHNINHLIKAMLTQSTIWLIIIKYKLKMYFLI